MYPSPHLDAFFPTLGSISSATCVSQCPSTNTTTVTCLPDGVNCFSTNPTITASYATTSFLNYCVPTFTVNNQDISQAFNSNAFTAWAVDLQRGWMVLVGAAVIAMVASLLFLLVIRCCSGGIIWISIFICIVGLELVGILFILQAKGISINQFVTDNISTISYNSLIIIGSGFIVGGVLFALIVACLRSRIALGSKSV